jgi:hypothetical protein
LIEIAQIFAVWPLNSCHAAQRIQQKSVYYALKFVRRAVMNAPNTKWSIVSNAPKPAIDAPKNAGKWDSVFAIWQRKLKIRILREFETAVFTWRMKEHFLRG